jgi:putative membrane protein
MQIVRWIVGATIFVALLFLSLQNSGEVTLRFYNVWQWSAPLIFVVLIAFAIGVAAGLLAGAVRTSRVKRQLKRLHRDRGHADPASAGGPPSRPYDGA